MWSRWKRQNSLRQPPPYHTHTHPQTHLWSSSTLRFWLRVRPPAAPPAASPGSAGSGGHTVSRLKLASGTHSSMRRLTAGGGAGRRWGQHEHPEWRPHHTQSAHLHSQGAAVKHTLRSHLR